MKRVFPILAVMLFFLAACSYYSVDDLEDPVVSKVYYQDPYTTTTYITINKVMMPQAHYHGGYWVTEVSGKIDGDTKTVSVTGSSNEDEKPEYEVGTRYPVTEQ